jgi:peroxiredoxin
MIELGEFERDHAEFDRRGVHMFAISNDTPEDVQRNQADLPHVVFLADQDQSAAKTLQLSDDHGGPNGEPTNTPTLIFVDGQGIVRQLLRPANLFTRHTSAEVLAEIDAQLAPDRTKSETN